MKQIPNCQAHTKQGKPCRNKGRYTDLSGDAYCLLHYPQGIAPLKYKNARSFLGQNLSHYMNYDYEYSPCECEDRFDYICRCRRIEDVDIKSINLNDIANLWTWVTPLERYCINRILTINNLFDPQYWCHHIRGGYYGEELEGIYLVDAEKPIEQIDKLLSLPYPAAQVEHILCLEYGYLLDDIRDRQWEIQDIPVNQVTFNDGYQKKIQGKYPYAPDVVGVALTRRGQYWLIDGYHRFTDAITKDQEKHKKSKKFHWPTIKLLVGRKD